MNITDDTAVIKAVTTNNTTILNEIFTQLQTSNQKTKVLLQLLNFLTEEYSTLSDDVRTTTINGVINLIESRADLNSKDKKGRTPLHLATSCGIMNLVRVLTRRGANIDIQDSNGDTPLHYAIKAGLPQEDVSLLVNSGANIFIANNDGKKAKDLVPIERRDLTMLLRVQNVKTLRIMRKHILAMSGDGTEVQGDESYNSKPNSPNNNSNRGVGSRSLEGWLFFKKNRKSKWKRRYCVARDGRFDIHKDESSFTRDNKPAKKTYMIKDTTVERCLVAHERFVAEKSRKRKDKSKREEKAVHRFEMLVFPNEKSTSFVSHLFASQTAEELNNWISFWKEEVALAMASSNTQTEETNNTNSAYEEMTSEAFTIAENRIVVPVKIGDRLTLGLEQLYRTLGPHLSNRDGVDEFLLAVQYRDETKGEKEERVEEEERGERVMGMEELELAYHTSPSAVSNAVERAGDNLTLLVQFLFYLFDELPEPLLTYTARDKFIEALSIIHPISRLSTFRTQITQVPLQLQRRLMSLLGFCSTMVSSTDDRLTWDKCADIFWFYLIRQEGDRVMGVSPSHPCPEDARAVVVFIMKHHDKLFKYSKPQEDRQKLENDLMAFKRRLHTDGPLFCLELDVNQLYNNVMQLENEEVSMVKWDRLEKRLDCLHHFLAEEQSNSEEWRERQRTKLHSMKEAINSLVGE